MAERLRLGICSLVHDHVWGELRSWQHHHDVEVVAVGEPSERLRQKAVGHGVQKSYDSWQEMLEKEKLDIVQAASDNASCAEIVEAAMAHGAHVVSEKPMAATLAQAVRMMTAAEQHGKLLMINWPHMWDPAYQEWERIILEGQIGRLLHLKRRNAHSGPKEIGCDPAFCEWLYDADRNGAGALMDYCCYGADIAARLLGLPKRVTGIRAVLNKEYPVPDDNAIILMQYEKAFAQTEASWTEVAHAPGPYTIAYGEEGVCSFDGGSVTLIRKGQKPEQIIPRELVYPMTDAPTYFVHCLNNGQPIGGCCSAKVSRDAQEILEAGLRSTNSGCHVELPVGR